MDEDGGWLSPIEVSRRSMARGFKGSSLFRRITQPSANHASRFDDG